MKRFLATTSILILLGAVFAAGQYQGNSNGAFAQGPGAAGSAVVGNPVLVGGSDGTNARNLFVDNSGRAILGTGATAGDGATASAVFPPGTASTSGEFAMLPYGLAGGGLANPFPACELSAIQNAVGATTTQIVALSGTTRVRICSVIVDQTATTCTNCTWKLVSGTGTNCATGTADLTTTLGMSQASTTSGVEFAFTYPGGGLRAPAAAAVCVTGAGTTPSLNTQITYSQW